MTALFDRLESEVRGYCRSFPTVFQTAKNAVLTDEAGREFIDFLSGAGTLNYGHNNDVLKKKILRYIEDDGVIHGLDMHTTAKKDFLETFDECILRRRNLRYKIQFTGPTGTNAVEAALKLARKVKGRTNIVSFTNSFHGVTLGSVAATGNTHFREGGGVPLGNTTFMPYDGYLGEGVDTLTWFRKFLEDASSGVDTPAAVIVETVQGEGGVNVASFGWLRRLEALCREFDILLIVDDIQVGNGRTGTFFSFEKAGIQPDMVTLSKSLGAYGLPMAILLLRPELDVWKPGEHNGTFRGNNLAFVAAAEAIREYWRDSAFSRDVEEKSLVMEDRLKALERRYPWSGLRVRGRGMIWGVDFGITEAANEVGRGCFRNGLIAETTGSKGHVLKILPPLTIETPRLEKGLEVLSGAVAGILSGSSPNGFKSANGVRR